MRKRYIPNNQIGLFEYLTQQEKELDQQEIQPNTIQLEDIPQTEYNNLVQGLVNANNIQISKQSNKIIILFNYWTNKGFEKLRIIVYTFYLDKPHLSNTFLNLNFHPKISYVYDIKSFKNIYECIRGIKENTYNGPNEIGEGYYVTREDTEHTIREIDDKELLDYD